ncbi:MAG TPA: nucleotidyltransferase domain-containing protein [Pseudobdellovibrionaceae bacterium]|nr:nucleotidyltransferase domain-containing protein [Pseudobdellovibrionaceae bacterium]
MKNIGRLFSKKIPESERKLLMTTASNFIRSCTSPIKIIFFGSILTENFDASSDIDMIILFNSPKEADLGRRKLYSSTQPNLKHSLEMICVDEKTFKEKSQIGGLYAIANESGFEF